MNTPETSTYITYVNRALNLKTLNVFLNTDNDYHSFNVENIQEDFFITGFFKNNLPVYGLGFDDLDNTNQLAFINSTLSDFALCQPQSFFNANTLVTLTYDSRLSLLSQNQNTNSNTIILPYVYTVPQLTPIPDLDQFVTLYDFSVELPSFRPIPNYDAIHFYINSNDTYTFRYSDSSNVYTLFPFPYFNGISRTHSLRLNNLFIKLDQFVISSDYHFIVYHNKITNHVISIQYDALTKTYYNFESQFVHYDDYYSKSVLPYHSPSYIYLSLNKT